MSKNERQDLTDATPAPQANDMLRREAAAHHASNPGLRTSPPAVEATLATISAEVMAEALERLHRQTKT